MNITTTGQGITLKSSVAVTLLLILLSACSTTNGRYQQKHDSTPVRTPTAAELHDAIPRIETPSRGGNKHYQVRGKHYQVMSSAKGFEQTGIASWYGQKFHGHLTSNGEIYDMYAMSAAHKNLPLPTYAKVTNLANNKSVIVRVNDRGPFHQSRVIDLSYSAAYKLDMLKTGTARVHIVAISEDNIAAIMSPSAINNIAASSSTNTVVANTLKKQPAFEDSQPAPAVSINNSSSDSTSTNKAFYIQAFATKSLASAKKAARHLSNHLSDEIIYPYSNGIYRVFVSPSINVSNIAASEIDNAAYTAQQNTLIETQQRLLEKVKNLGYSNAFIKQKI